MKITMDRACNYFIFLAALTLHFLPTCSTLNSNIHDLDALLAFKASLSDPNNTLHMNWSTSTYVCNWIGITCNAPHERVAAIDLPDRGLIGTIPSQLGNLSFLVRLNVQNNSFHGELPRELENLHKLKNISLDWNQFDGVFPSWLGGLTKLQYLSFSHNSFSGSLPSTLFNASNLDTIKLQYNLLTGNLPQEFGLLQKLQVLDMGYNRLRGSLPPALFNLSSLKLLSFSNNSLSGYFPERMCDHLQQLQYVYMSFNELQGEIPSGINECSRLEILSLSYNKLSGKIPRQFWNVTTLRIVFLGGNDLQGEISEEIGNFHNLERLGMETTNLTGVIPQGIGNLSKLEEIDLSMAKLKGSIPLQLFNISTLRIISLGSSNFSGNLPSTLGTFLPNLEKLYLGRSKLSGSVLTSISNASKLTQLELSYNQFTGVIPHSLGDLRFLKTISIAENNFSQDSLSGELSFFNSLTKCRNLKILWISSNPLNGFLPFSIGNLSSSLQLFAAGQCGINGKIPSSIGNLSELTTLDLQSNRLSGMIPKTLKWLSKLQRLSLADNKIGGSIPDEFCDVLNLGWLGLGQNMLSKTVPSCIGNLTSLRYLDLNSNNLTSSLPASFWSLKDILEIDLSTNSLTGFLPSQIDKFKALVLMDLSMNYFSGEIPSTIGALQTLQELSLAHNNLQGLIPESIKNMLSLQYLDLSFNNLSGMIPNSLEKLSNLQYFNVSYNKLRGPIPLGGPFVNFTNMSFLSNEALCGAHWLQLCPTFEHKSRTKRVVLFVLLGVGSFMLALVIPLSTIIRKLRRKTVAPSEDLFPTTSTCERVSFYEIRQITNGFHESNLLGSGTFGSVYKGIRANGMIWAIKVFDLQQEDAFKSFDRECEVLRCLRHRNLTKVFSACSSPDFKALVLEYMPHGSLEKWLYLDGNLDFKQRLDIMIDVACGLEYLHYGYSVPVIHGDLKPSNILLDQDMVGHVNDFGISKLLEDGESVVRTKTLATFGYIAPEYGLEGLVSTSCDVYSFGIILMETFTRRKPNDEMFTEDLTIRQWIQESTSDSVLQVIDPKLLDLEDELATKRIACVSSILQLALSCTTNAPEERINTKDVVIALQKIKIQFLQANYESPSIKAGL